MKRYVIDYALGYDLEQAHGDVGFYVVDMKSYGWCDVVAEFQTEGEAIAYCDLINAPHPHKT